MYEYEAITEAEKAFANHIPSYHTCADIAVLDWYNKDGSTFYAVRYVFDGENLYISGDLGSAVLTLTEKATIDSIAKYQVNYFVNQIVCSTDSYDFDIDIAEQEVRDYIYGTIENSYDDWDCLDEDADYNIEMFIYELIEESKFLDGLCLNQRAKGFLRKIKKIGDFSEFDFEDFGKTVSKRVIFWLVGIKMAQKKLGEKRLIE